MVYGIRGDDELVRFSPSSPGSVLSLGSFPTVAGDTIVGLDRRPDDDQLYAVSRLGSVFLAEIVGSANPSLMATEIQPIMGPGTTLPATGRIGTDFNPTANALRVIADDGANLRIPTGALTIPEMVPPIDTIVDGNMGYKKGVTAAAYSNPHPDFEPEMGEPATQLFVIDSEDDFLYLQNANEGELSFVAELNVNVSSVNGYDIFQGGADDPNEHFVVTASGVNTLLYLLDPETGVMTLTTTLEGVNEARGLVVIENAPPTAPIAPPLRALVLDSSGDEDVIKSFAFNRQPFELTGTPVTTLTVSGLMPGERLVGIDSRTTSRDGNRVDTVYAVTSQDRVVALDDVSGDVLAVADAAPLSTALNGNAFAVDFNPAVDLLRILSDEGQNLRVNLDVGRELQGEARARGFAFVDRTTRIVLPDEGDGATPKLGPQIVATAYRAAPVDGSFQFAIDADNSTLARVVVPNDGALEVVGPLGSGLTLPRNGMAVLEQSLDIAGPDDSLALAALRLAEENRSALYSVNLETGAVTLLGTIGASGSDPVGSITVRFE